jgi:hypothetical protein
MDPPWALRLWAGGFRFVVALLNQMEDSTAGRINLYYSLFILQYSFFISLQGFHPLQPQQLFEKSCTKNF